MIPIEDTINNIGEMYIHLHPARPPRYEVNGRNDGPCVACGSLVSPLTIVDVSSLHHELCLLCGEVLIELASMTGRMQVEGGDGGVKPEEIDRRLRLRLAHGRNEPALR